MRHFVTDLIHVLFDPNTTVFDQKPTIGFINQVNHFITNHLFVNALVRVLVCGSVPTNDLSVFDISRMLLGRNVSIANHVIGLYGKALTGSCPVDGQRFQKRIIAAVVVVVVVVLIFQLLAHDDDQNYLFRL